MIGLHVIVVKLGNVAESGNIASAQSVELGLFTLVKRQFWRQHPIKARRWMLPPPYSPHHPTES